MIKIVENQYPKSISEDLIQYWSKVTINQEQFLVKEKWIKENWRVTVSSNTKSNEKNLYKNSAQKLSCNTATWYRQNMNMSYKNPSSNKITIKDFESKKKTISYSANKEY